MSKGTPTREARIERHLMRQRGAGVRAITADFGFSFALPTVPLIAPVPTPIEPPTKRRKTNEHDIASGHENTVQENGEVDCRSFKELVKERDAAPSPTKAASAPPLPAEYLEIPADIPLVEQPIAALKPARKPGRPRRRLHLEDVEVPSKPTKSAAEPGSLEDTFVFGLKSAAKPQQPKKKNDTTVVTDTITEAAAKDPLPKKKRATKAKAQTNEIPENVVVSPALLEVLTTDKLPATVSVVEEDIQPTKRSRKPKQALAGEPTADHGTRTPNAPPTDNRVTEDVKDHAVTEPPKKRGRGRPKLAIPKQVDFAELKAASAETAGNEEKSDSGSATNPMARPKSNAAPRSSAQAPMEPIANVPAEPSHETTTSKKARKAVSAKPAAKRTLKATSCADKTTTESETAVLPEPTARRPRRQAAISASEKVALGYEEALVPTDKLRRAPEPAHPQVEKPKRSNTRKEAPTEELPANVADVTTTPGSPTNPDEVELPPSITKPVKKGPRSGSKSIKGKTAPKEEVLRDTKASEPPELLKLPELFVPETQEAHPMSSKSSVPADVPPKKPRRTKANALPQDHSSAGINDNKSVETIVVENQEPSAVVREAALVAPKKSRKVEAEPRPTKTRQALAESDINIVRMSPLKEKPEKPLKHADSRPESEPQQAKKSVKAASERQPRGTKRAREPQSTLPPPEPALNDTQSPVPASSARKRHKIAGDDDLDWLFEKSAPKRPQPTANRRAVAKAPRSRPDQASKDMDLDDLLESIAGFSGKVLTSKRGRAVAS